MARFSILYNVLFNFLFSTFILFFAFANGIRAFSFKNKLIYFILFKSYVIVTYTHFVRHIVQRATSLFNSSSSSIKGVPIEKPSQSELMLMMWNDYSSKQNKCADLLMHWMNLSMLTLVPHRIHSHWRVQAQKGAEKSSLRPHLKIHNKPIFNKVRQLIVWHCSTCSVLWIYRHFQTNYNLLSVCTANHPNFFVLLSMW